MEWLRKNGAVALGVGLPLLLVAFFALAALVPAYLVAPPKYDVLYLSNYSDYGTNNLRYQVQNGHVSFVFTGNNYTVNWPKLYRFYASTGAIKEIAINVPPEVPRQQYKYGAPQDNTQVTVAVPVPEAEALTLDTSSKAPDGYEFEAMIPRSGGLFGEVFFGYGRYRDIAVLSKNGNRVKLSNPSGNYWGNAKFIGWVVAQ